MQPVFNPVSRKKVLCIVWIVFMFVATLVHLTSHGRNMLEKGNEKGMKSMHFGCVPQNSFKLCS